MQPATFSEDTCYCCCWCCCHCHRYRCQRSLCRDRCHHQCCDHCCCHSRSQFRCCLAVLMLRQLHRLGELCLSILPAHRTGVRSYNAVLRAQPVDLLQHITAAGVWARNRCCARAAVCCPQIGCCRPLQPPHLRQLIVPKLQVLQSPLAAAGVPDRHIREQVLTEVEGPQAWGVWQARRGVSVAAAAGDVAAAVRFQRLGWCVASEAHQQQDKRKTAVLTVENRRQLCIQAEALECETCCGMCKRC